MTSAPRLTRRQFLTGMSAAAAAALVENVSHGASSTQTAATPYKPTFFTAPEWSFVTAAVARLIPDEGEGPGGVQAGVPEFIDRQLELPYGHGGFQYTQGPFVPDSVPTLGYQLKYTPRELYRLGIAAVDRVTQQRWQKRFSELTGDQQDQFLSDMERNAIPLEGPPCGAVFAQILAIPKKATSLIHFMAATATCLLGSTSDSPAPAPTSQIGLTRQEPAIRSVPFPLTASEAPDEKHLRR
jgi:gluconate 2-dehydrogenase gamma chain